MNVLYLMARVTFGSLFRTYFRWRVCNADRVPFRGPVILASNHESYLDPPLIGTAVARDIYYLGRESLFRNPVVGAVLRGVNSLPVDRDGGGAAGLRAIMDRLKAGEAILLFPEGTRTSDGRLQRARSGIGLAVIKNECPVVPIRVCGAYAAFGRHLSVPRPRRIVVKFGKPIDFADLRREAEMCSKARLREIYQIVADRLMAEIGRLGPYEDKETFG